MFKDKKCFFFTACGIYLLWLVIFSYFYYQHLYSTLLSDLDKQLVTAAEAVPYILPEGFHHKKMHEGSISKEEDLRLLEKLAAYAEKADVIYVYSLILKNGRILFSSSSALEEEVQQNGGEGFYFFHYDDADPQLYSLFDKKKPLFLDVTDQWGAFRSVFIPKKAEDGMTYLVGADVHTDDISALARHTLIETIVIVTLFLLFALPIFWLFYSHLRQWNIQLASQVAEQTSNLRKSESRLHMALSAANQTWFDMDASTGELEVGIQNLRENQAVTSAFTTSFNKWLAQQHPDDQAGVKAAFEKALSTGIFDNTEFRRPSNDEGWEWTSVKGEVVEQNQDSEFVRVLGILTDISKQKNAEQLGTRRRAVLEQIITGQTLGTILPNIAKMAETGEKSVFCIISFADSAAQHLSVASAPSAPAFLREALSRVDITENSSCCATSAKTKQSHVVEDIETEAYPTTYKKLLSRANVKSCCSVPITDRDGNLLGTISLFYSDTNHPNKEKLLLLESLSSLITLAVERIQADDRLHLFSCLFESTHEGVMVTDEHASIIDVNPAFSRITGYSREEILGEKPNTLSSGEHTKQFYAQMWQSLEKHDSWEGELWNTTKNGEIYLESIAIYALKNRFGEVKNYVGMFYDITKTRKQQNELELMAHYDPLTHLPNRVLFRDRFNQAVAHASRTGTMLALVFVDLDKFKTINDTYGHEAGDIVLIEIANRIKKTLRREDSASRQGGDEFVLILRDLDSIEDCKDTVKRLLDAIIEPILIDEYGVEMSASCGIAFYSYHEDDLETLIRRADKAMYEAKLAGRNGFRLAEKEVL